MRTDCGTELFRGREVALQNNFFLKKLSCNMSVFVDTTCSTSFDSFL